MGCFVLGVDGGGTKTDLALADMETGRLWHERIGCTNHELLKGGFAELGKLLGDALTVLTEKAEIFLNQIDAAVFGLAGVDTRQQQICAEEVVGALGFQRFLVCNDAFLPIKAGNESGVGIAAINGTGCTVAGIDRTGRRLQLGGMGALTGDCGGGAYLGRCATSAVYDALYRGAPATKMSALLRRAVGAAREGDIFELLPELLANQTLRLRDLNRIVFEAACTGDAVALRILTNMGAENARSIVALIRGMDFGEKLSVILAGSIYRRGEHPAAVEELKRVVSLACPERKLRFMLLEAPPVAGAVLWAAETVSQRSTEADMRKRVINASQGFQ